MATVSIFAQVVADEPSKTLSYTWQAYGLESVVIWTLTPSSTGTHLRMEQSGFQSDQQQAYQGAKGGWQRFVAALEEVVARIGRTLPPQFEAGSVLQVYSSRFGGTLRVMPDRGSL